MTHPFLVERDREEQRRSAEEAKKIVLRNAQVKRYLDPPADTAYALEYAFYLLGDVRGKHVLDLGCGTGENLVPLARRGACVSGIDVSPELITLAEQRVKRACIEAVLKVGSAYETGVPSGSVDVVFCIALIHHLDIDAVRAEMLRILTDGGVVILSEPVRFSAAYNGLRQMFPTREDVSENEHPLTRHEFATFTKGFKAEGARFFRLPFIPLMEILLPARVLAKNTPWIIDRWLLQHVGATQRFASNVTVRLRKEN